MDAPLICPKCFTIESEGSLRCRKCGAQLHTGVFQQPIIQTPPETTGAKPARLGSLRANAIAVGAFAVAVLALVLILTLLESSVP